MEIKRLHGSSTKEAVKADCGYYLGIPQQDSNAWGSVKVKRETTLETFFRE